VFTYSSSLGEIVHYQFEATYGRIVMTTKGVKRIRFVLRGRKDCQLRLPTNRQASLGGRIHQDGKGRAGVEQ